MENKEGTAVDLADIKTPTLLEQNVPPILVSRNSYGLLASADVKYIYNDDGTVNYRKMIPSKFLYVNPSMKKREEIERKYGKSYKEIDIEADNVADIDIIQTLGAIKFLANLRKFLKVEYRPIVSNEEFASTVCSITWSQNYETENCVICFESIGSASLATTNGFGNKYLIEMAENRAFCRAVRNFLRINIVSKDELLPENANSQVTVDDEPQMGSEPHNLLLQKMKAHGKSFDQVIEKLKKDGIDTSGIKEVSQIPKMQIFKLLGALKD